MSSSLAAALVFEDYSYTYPVERSSGEVTVQAVRARKIGTWKVLVWLGAPQSTWRMSQRGNFKYQPTGKKQYGRSYGPPLLAIKLNQTAQGILGFSKYFTFSESRAFIIFPVLRTFLRRFHQPRHVSAWPGCLRPSMQGLMVTYDTVTGIFQNLFASLTT